MLERVHVERTVKLNAHTLYLDPYHGSPFKWLPSALYFRLPHL